jgi:hypothetical protein
MLQRVVAEVLHAYVQDRRSTLGVQGPRGDQHASSDTLEQWLQNRCVRALAIELTRFGNDAASGGHVLARHVVHSAVFLKMRHGTQQQQQQQQQLSVCEYALIVDKLQLHANMQQALFTLPPNDACQVAHEIATQCPHLVHYLHQVLTPALEHTCANTSCKQHSLPITAPTELRLLFERMNRHVEALATLDTAQHNHVQQWLESTRHNHQLTCRRSTDSGALISQVATGSCSMSKALVQRISQLASDPPIESFLSSLPSSNTNRPSRTSTAYWHALIGRADLYTSCVQQVVQQHMQDIAAHGCLGILFARLQFDIQRPTPLSRDTFDSALETALTMLQFITHSEQVEILKRLIRNAPVYRYNLQVGYNKVECC